MDEYLLSIGDLRQMMLKVANRETIMKVQDVIDDILKFRKPAISVARGEVNIHPGLLFKSITIGFETRPDIIIVSNDRISNIFHDKANIELLMVDNL